jgi:hypothetical protein
VTLIVRRRLIVILLVPVRRPTRLIWLSSFNLGCMVSCSPQSFPLWPLWVKHASHPTLRKTYQVCAAFRVHGRWCGSGMRAALGQGSSQCVRHPSGATYDPSFLTRCSFQLPVSHTCFINACIDKRYETQVHSSSFTSPSHVRSLGL